MDPKHWNVNPARKITKVTSVLTAKLNNGKTVVLRSTQENIYKKLPTKKNN